MKRAQRDISKRLADWKKEKHYGMDQNLMHACAGWFVRRNLLNIDIPERLLPGYSALNATPCPPAATHDLLCVCAVGMHVTALLNHAGVGIDHGSVNLLDHDLEEIIRKRAKRPVSEDTRPVRGENPEFLHTVTTTRRNFERQFSPVRRPCGCGSSSVSRVAAGLSSPPRQSSGSGVGAVSV